MAPLSWKSNVPLAFNAWIPYSLESKITYFFTYFHQIVCIMMAACITASVESLAMVIMLHICAQLEIIVHRLKSLPRLQEKSNSQSIIYELESKLIKDCVNHHIHTYTLGENLNETFGPVIFVQFFVSVIALGAVIYPMSKLSTSLYDLNTWRLIFTFASTISQIFLYCFYGDKMMEKSMAIAEEVYQIDWIETTIKTKKNLTSIMMRAEKPIKLTGLSIIIMTIETFFKIIKSAYSAYNVLKKT
ncbi:odorant receptor 9a-like [Belonocnema kinseyi]|uniref:odorant receptor 9a-like n=1 Tax=Belonocnema kinseyi TaxID=2817044 RepID=UPI00143D01E1|nr:odorant receptor 9a-like [Belonocnema kinseyi]